MSNIETGTAKVSLTTIVKIANALSVTVDDLLCDNLVHAKVPFEQDIQQLLDGCNELEIRLIKDLIESTLNTLRRDANLRGNHCKRSIIDRLFNGAKKSDNNSTGT
jgi:transcriptional regulator with XRE-family HTH domain